METNRYAKLCLESRRSDDDDDEITEWETNADEIRAYLGFTLLMGINRIQDVYDYWSTNPVFHYFPITSRISRNRFLEIKRYLHFVNNATQIIPNTDKLFKVRPVTESIRQKCLSNYEPHKDNSIDEAMIKFKGRSSLKQYLPMKPIKRGFKVWMRADSCNGYVCEFYVYCGKDGETVATNLETTVVTKLSRSLVGGSYHLYFDNYFTSVALMESLLQDGIYACGTYRKDRKCVPLDIKNVKLGM